MSDAVRHPGEILRDEFLTPLCISGHALSRDLGVPPDRISKILNGSRSITADTALRLGRYFGSTPEFWLHLQVQHDLAVERAALGDRLEAEVRVWQQGPAFKSGARR